MRQRKILTKQELDELSRHIAEIEKKTTAEIRIVVRHRKHWSEHKLNARQIAAREFKTLGMKNTDEGTGVLMFVLLRERKFELLADTGVFKVLPSEFWTMLGHKLSAHFSKSNFFVGLEESLDEIGKVLEEKLPLDGKHRGELPNDIIEE